MQNAESLSFRHDGQSAQTHSKFARTASIAAIISMVLIVAGVLVWQGITAQGSPNPTPEQAHASPTVAVVNIGVLVFREGLECILVLSAITASMTGAKRLHKQPVVAGAGIGFIATLITWFIAVGIINDLTHSVSALNLQAATGLLAVVVLLVVMNWFFHKLYWGGWITMHNKKKKELIKGAEAGLPSIRVLWGLALLGFASMYREGFEVVLFLQSYRLQMGEKIVLFGSLIGLGLSGMAAVLTFVAHRRLPYRKMLIFTGVLLGVVLLVMVGEQAQEMQQANWIPSHDIAALKPLMPDWTGVWFSVFPNVETLLAQGLAALLVVGSFFLARKQSPEPKRDAVAAA